MSEHEGAGAAATARPIGSLQISRIYKAKLDRWFTPDEYREYLRDQKRGLRKFISKLLGGFRDG